jgi:hypothetical protein
MKLRGVALTIGVLFIFSFIGAVKLGAQPSESLIKKQLGNRFPFAGIVSFEVKASENAGTKVEPMWKFRFVAKAVFTEDLLNLERTVLSTNIVRQVAAKGSPFDIYGIAVATLKKELWEVSFEFEENPLAFLAPADNLRLRGELKGNLVMAGTVEEKVLDAKTAIKAVVDAKGEIYARDELAKLNSDLGVLINQIGDRSKQNISKIDVDRKLTEIIASAQKVKAFIPNRVTECRNAASTAINEARAAHGKTLVLLRHSSGIPQADFNAMKADLTELGRMIGSCAEMSKNGDFFGAKDRAEAMKKKADAISEQIASYKRS